MTKLLEWLTALSIVFAIYVSLVTRQIKNQFTEAWMYEIQIAPIVAVGLFGVSESQIEFSSNPSKGADHILIYLLQAYSIFIVLYRTFTFNDCPEAADEVQRQIKEAKEDLASKGLKL